MTIVWDEGAHDHRVDRDGDGLGDDLEAFLGTCDPNIPNRDTIRQVVIASGAVTTLAGSAGRFGSVDGKGAAARFNFPGYIANDNAGNLFVADQYIGMGYGGTIRKVTISTGIVTTVVGSPGRFGIVPGPLPAQSSIPRGLAFVSPAQLFITDVGENVALVAQF